MCPIFIGCPHNAEFSVLEFRYFSFELHSISRLRSFCTRMYSYSFKNHRQYIYILYIVTYRSTQSNERKQTMSTILSDLDIVYPPQSSLPKEQGTHLLCRLTQYPSKDEQRNIIEGEYTNCCFTSAFGKQANLVLPDGSTLSLTANKWRRNQDGNITNPTSGDQLTFWFQDTDADEEKLKYCIENSIFYLYGDAANPDADLILPDTYKTMMERINSQTMVHPIDSKIEPDAVRPELTGN